MRSRFPRTLTLQRHPTTPSAAIEALGVDLAPERGGLRLCYRLEGDPAAVRVPAPRPARAADGLWRHTCCEAFFATTGDPAYREFNFSPSGEWAAYGFSACRVRDPALGERLAASLEADDAPAIAWRRDRGGFVLEAWLPAATLPRSAAWDLGLSAVIEAADGTLAYWALRHPAPQPDFHHRDAFALAIDDPTRPKP